MLGFDRLPASVSLIQFPVIDNSFDLKYINTSDQEVSIAATAFKYFDGVDGGKPYINQVDTSLDLSFADREDAFQVSFSAGYTPENLPKPLYQAILLMIADMYEFRTDRTEIINRASMALMRPYKVWV